MILKTDCKLFPGDRPCKPNKLYGIMCNDCDYYDPVKFKILIIKLDAVGDVLRTTSLLPTLKEKYPDSHISWITRKNAAPIFTNNPLVDEVLEFESTDTLARLEFEEFDLMINPDAATANCALASNVSAAVKKGFQLDKKGKVIPIDEDAVEWLEMGAFDQYKKRNEKSYQQIIHELSGLDYNKSEIIIELSSEEIEFGKQFYDKSKLNRFDILIGINSGASTRWQLKQWRLDGFKDLIRKLTVNEKTGILIFGGPDEKERNKQLTDIHVNVIDTGTNNSLREFFSLINLVDVMITGDTMALHAATALKKKIVCTFGPTSHNEIEDYGRIIKIYPDMECLVCYKPECDYEPNCMDLISSDQIYNAVLTQLEEIKKAGV